MRNKLRSIIYFFVNIPVKFLFWIQRWIIDRTFIVNLRNNKLRPKIFDYPIWFIITGLRFFKICWNEVFVNYAINKYSKWVKIHYSNIGRGYFGYENYNKERLKKLYGNSIGAIKYFLDKNNKILSYKDGDTFLDAGCGMGSNINILNSNFPNSLIEAFDIDPRAVEIVKLGTLNIKNISINIGDLTDINYLNKISSNKFDHIIVSHVFSFILSEDTDNTVILRQSIIDNLIRISKKTIIIIDNNNILHIDKPEFEIEQIHRGHFKESIIKYFASHLNHGEVCSLYSDSSVGVLFIKN